MPENQAYIAFVEVLTYNDIQNVQKYLRIFIE